jgi:hypothetical protein
LPVLAEEGLKAAEIALGEGFGHTCTGKAVRLAVKGAGRGDDITAIRKQINALPFLAGEMQVWREVKVKMREPTSGRTDSSRSHEVREARLKGSQHVRRVKVEDDETADASGDDAETGETLM